MPADHLPLDRDRALAAITNGWGRTPTAAHPDCRCGRPYTATCHTCQAKPNKPCHQPTHEKDFDIDDTRVDGRHPGRTTRTATHRDCPIHRGATRT